MLFSSPIYFLFFAVYLALHRLARTQWRLGLVIAGSAIFYSYWNPWFCWVPFLLTAMAYGAGLWVAPEGPRRGMRLAVALAVMLLPLAAFKYTNFLAANLFGATEKVLQIALPLGISFVTFSMIAYVVDVYRGVFPVQRRPGALVAYTLFFPHLIAGPILRPADLVPQLQRLQQLDFGRVRLGLAVFTLGLVKKLVISDPIGTAVDAIYANPAGLDALDSLLAIVGFTIQIYCDFSGYTDMAIGSALVLGVRLPTNFMRPYVATSIIDFWRRWHITLSLWLRDYLYIPLGGNRMGFARQAANVMVTMALGGLWHGANWTFVLWGIGHGGLIVANHALVRWVPAVASVPKAVRRIVTVILVALLWVVFRSPDLATAGAILSGLAGPIGDAGAFAARHAYVLAMAALFALTHAWDDHRRVMGLMRKTPAMVGLAVIGVLWMIAITVSTGNSGKFVYFDF